MVSLVFSNCGRMVMGDWERYLGKLERIFLARVKTRVLAALDGMDAALLEKIEAATTDGERAALFDRMRDLRLARDGLEAHIESDLAEGFARLRRRAMERGPRRVLMVDDFEEPTLGEVTEGNAADERLGPPENILASRVRLREAGRLATVHLRLMKLLPGVDLEGDESPLGPGVIYGAFANAMEACEIRQTGVDAVWETFDRAVGEELGAIYAEIDRILADAGLFPQVLGAVSGDVLRASGFVGSTFSMLRGYIDHDVRRRILGVVDQRSVAGNVKAIDTWSVDAVFNAVDLVRSRQSVMLSSEPYNVMGPIELKTAIDGALWETYGYERRLKNTHLDAIIIVGLCFAAINGLQDVPDRMKRLLLRLELPVLKVVLSDPDGLSDRCHPVRCCFRRFGCWLRSVTSMDEDELERLYDRIRVGVEEILREFKGDVEIFAQAFRQDDVTLGIAATSWNALVEKSPVRDRQADPVEPGAGDDAGMRARAQAAIDQGLAAVVVPDAIGAILREGWTEVLAGVEPEDTDGWTHGVDVMERLLWSLEPKATPGERAALIQAIPSLLKDLRAGFDRCKLPAATINRYFSDLQDYHLKIVRGEVSWPKTVPAIANTQTGGADENNGMASSELPDGRSGVDQEWLDFEGSPAVAVDDDVQSGIEIYTAALEEEPGCATGGERMAEADEWHTKLQEIAYGTWFEFWTRMGRVRAQFVGKLEDPERWVFTDPNGDLLGYKTVPGLARELSDGAASFIEPDDWLFERVLDAVIERLQESSSE